jgi:hypothetical protein
VLGWVHLRQATRDVFHEGNVHLKIFPAAGKLHQRQIFVRTFYVVGVSSQPHPQTQGLASFDNSQRNVHILKISGKCSAFLFS